MATTNKSGLPDHSHPLDRLTGRCDSRGRLICEGDMLGYSNLVGEREYGTVFWNKDLKEWGFVSNPYVCSLDALLKEENVICYG